MNCQKFDCPNEAVYTVDCGELRPEDEFKSYCPQHTRQISDYIIRLYLVEGFAETP